MKQFRLRLTRQKWPTDLAWRTDEQIKDKHEAWNIEHQTAMHQQALYLLSQALF